MHAVFRQTCTRQSFLTLGSENFTDRASPYNQSTEVILSSSSVSAIFSKLDFLIGGGVECMFERKLYAKKFGVIIYC